MEGPLFELGLPAIETLVRLYGMNCRKNDSTTMTYPKHLIFEYKMASHPKLALCINEHNKVPNWLIEVKTTKMVQTEVKLLNI